MSKYETAPYKVIESEGRFEIRQYEAFYTAAVEDTKLDGSNGFNQIFDYISGNNADQKKISMTTPVFNELGKDKTSTEFVMPTTFDQTTLPKPANPKVNIKRVESRVAAVMTFSGSVNEQKIKIYETELLEWIRQKDLQPSGNFRLARYNPPFMPPFLRRNEIMIDVIK